MVKTRSADLEERESLPVQKKISKAKKSPKNEPKAPKKQQQQKEKQNHSPKGGHKSARLIYHKRGTLEGYTHEQFKKYLATKEFLNKYTVHDLSRCLIRNEQPHTGHRDDLVDRVADGMVLGAIPKCPECKIGYLHFDKDVALYRCPGYFTFPHFQRCGKIFHMNEINRGPWIDELTF